MIFEKIKDIIVKQLEVDPNLITMDTSFVDDLDADSIEVVEMIVAFEDEFQVEIPEDEIEKVKTVRDIVNYFESL